LILAAFCLGTNFVYPFDLYLYDLYVAPPPIDASSRIEAAAEWSASAKKQMIEKEAEIASLQSQIEQNTPTGVPHVFRSNPTTFTLHMDTSVCKSSTRVGNQQDGGWCVTAGEGKFQRKM